MPAVPDRHLAEWRGAAITEIRSSARVLDPDSPWPYTWAQRKHALEVLFAAVNRLEIIERQLGLID